MKELRPGRGAAGPLLLAGAAVLLCGTLASVRTVRGQEPGGILFTDASTSGSDLFTMREDGTDRRNLTRSPEVREAQGDWSPDRSRVAFAMFDGGLWRIGVTEVATGASRPVTGGPEDLEPDWSPDGTRILFTAYFNRGTADQTSFLMTVPADGGAAVPLIRLSDPRYYIGNPRWSPDGRQIAFVVAGPSDGGEIYVADADGTNARRLLSHPGWDDIDPAWSPSGTHIAFASGTFAGSTGQTRHDIWLLDVALGVAGTVIVDESLDLRRPSWSPDGRRLVLDARAPAGPAGYALHTAPALGGELGPPLGDGAEPDWSGQAPPSPTPPVGITPSPTVTPEASVTPPLTPSPPPATDFPPLPTLPPFPTIPPPEPTEPGPPPTFPPPERAYRVHVPVALAGAPVAMDEDR